MTGRTGTEVLFPATRSGRVTRRVLRMTKETAEGKKGNPRRIILEVIVAGETKVRVKGTFYGLPDMEKEIGWDYQSATPRQFANSKFTLPETSNLSKMQALVLSYANNLYPNYQIRIGFEEVK